ncbi:MAG: hypothetical protein E5Y06_14880 [Mesorhizobium sp.]|uniref:hypothetical protein n=1 Tax=Mesorhizobium sp. TaxID=1871066 RepID=UPI0012092100|nr:hypothetical protein [Mesorhizobium sp.]TIN94745.1 MAG: hypothetical protein E5Y06_14880 [Mesorhizobium sp.]TJU96737.1 MAG: hypothetical protein E5Y08_20250 [Mesorhizobium sp.]
MLVNASAHPLMYGHHRRIEAFSLWVRRGQYPMIDEQDVEQLRTAGRAKVVTEARNAKLLDAAFAIISHNSSHQRFGPLGEGPLPIDLRVLRDRFSEVQIDDARRRARALFQDAFQAGEDALAQRFSHPEIVDKLRQRHPGFSDKCYQDTVRQGCFLAR